MHIELIKNDQDYQRVLKEIDRLMDARQDTPEGNRLDALATLVEAWEDEHFPIKPSTS
jgi:HTH-type transcriptional regulator / antitoxin HigA